MDKPRVTVLSLGGTITMTSEDGRGVRPSLAADSLVGAVPAIADVAEVAAETLDTKPGASLDFADAFQAISAARQAVEQGAAGVVIVQGTDTIEETAYLIDLHWNLRQPVVVTGAMRAPQTPGADGPANLLAAVRVAAASASCDLGALVVLNDEVHAAARVRKMRTSGTGAFDSPSFGRLGVLEEGEVVYGNRPVRFPALEEPDPLRSPRVALLETSFGDDGDLLRIVAGGGYEGAVIAGFGVGHLSAAYAEVIEEVRHSIPLVLASRTGAGTTYSRSYAFDGSESHLLSLGMIPAGWLDSRKARILLASLLQIGAGSERIRDEFLVRGLGARHDGAQIDSLDAARAKATRG
jgi:L-asparaginase